MAPWTLSELQSAVSELPPDLRSVEVTAEASEKDLSVSVWEVGSVLALEVESALVLEVRSVLALEVRSALA